MSALLASNQCFKNPSSQLQHTLLTYGKTKGQRAHAGCCSIISLNTRRLASMHVGKAMLGGNWFSPVLHVWLSLWSQMRVYVQDHSGIYSWWALLLVNWWSVFTLGSEVNQWEYLLFDRSSCLKYFNSLCFKGHNTVSFIFKSLLAYSSYIECVFNLHSSGWIHIGIHLVFLRESRILLIKNWGFNDWGLSLRLLIDLTNLIDGIPTQSRTLPKPHIDTGRRRSLEEKGGRMTDLQDTPVTIDHMYCNLKNDSLCVCHSA